MTEIRKAVAAMKLNSPREIQTLAVRGAAVSFGKRLQYPATAIGTRMRKRNGLAIVLTFFRQLRVGCGIRKLLPGDHND